MGYVSDRVEYPNVMPCMEQQVGKGFSKTTVAEQGKVHAKVLEGKMRTAMLAAVAVRRNELGQGGRRLDPTGETAFAIVFRVGGMFYL